MIKIGPNLLSYLSGTEGLSIDWKPYKGLVFEIDDSSNDTEQSEFTEIQEFKEVPKEAYPPTSVKVHAMRIGRVFTDPQYSEEQLNAIMAFCEDEDIRRCAVIGDTTGEVSYAMTSPNYKPELSSVFSFDLREDVQADEMRIRRVDAPPITSAEEMEPEELDALVICHSEHDEFDMQEAWVRHIVNSGFVILVSQPSVLMATPLKREVKDICPGVCYYKISDE